MYLLTHSSPLSPQIAKWMNIEIGQGVKHVSSKKICQALDYLIQPGNFRGKSWPDWISKPETILINQCQASALGVIQYLSSQRAMAEGILIESPPSLKRFDSWFYFFKWKLCSKLMHKKLQIPVSRFIRLSFFKSRSWARTEAIKLNWFWRWQVLIELSPSQPLNPSLLRF